MKNRKYFVLIAIYLTVFLIITFNALSRHIVENDEGVYWATFLLANKGYKLYSEIAFSQLPGFFISTYGIFKLFGSSIAAARSGVLYWSILALLSLVWIGYTKKNLIFSLLSIILLVSIPTFFNQTITLQSDIVAVSFSTLSFVFMLTFIHRQSYKLIWLLLSSLFFSFALLTKFDYSLVIPFGFILLTQKRSRIQNIFLFTILSILTLIVTLNLFGIDVVLNNVLALREKALAGSSFRVSTFFDLLKKDALLLILVLGNLMLIFKKWQKTHFFYSLLLWFISSLLLVFSFRPLFHHHLVFLAVPSSLLLSNFISNAVTPINQLIGVKRVIFLIIIITAFTNNFFSLIRRQNSRDLHEREIARNFILENTKMDDVIISDEAALYGMTGRLPPPELVDLSYVQIRSGNISSEHFQSTIKKYKPKLIIAWNGRLKQIKNFENSVSDYRRRDLLENKSIFLHNKYSVFVPANPEGW